jgi:hypothetical protein
MREIGAKKGRIWMRWPLPGIFVATGRGENGPLHGTHPAWEENSVSKQLTACLICSN